MYTAHVIARQGKTYIVEDSHGQKHTCHVRKIANDAVCGDIVECESIKDSQDVIARIHHRKNQLTRLDNFNREKTVAANIDHILIVIAPAPAYSTSLIDKYLACAQLNQCKTTLVVNKAELLYQYNIDIHDLENTYKELSDHFIVTSAKLGYGIQQLRQILSNETSIFVGQSGVGKSSLINRILHNTNIKVGDLSENIQQGKHTTTNAFAHNIIPNGKLIDSPGVRTFMPVFNNSEEVILGYKEFLPYLGQCKFSDCQHINEPQCAIKAAVDLNVIKQSRYESYIENIKNK